MTDDDGAYKPERRSNSVPDTPAPRSKDELKNRLQTLIARSNIYVSFISKKLESQQEALRTAAAKEKEQETKKTQNSGQVETKNTEPTKETEKEKKPAMATRRTTRNKSGADDDTTKTVTSKTKRSRPMPKKQQNAKKPTTISDYFGKKDLPVGNGTPTPATTPASTTALGEQEDLRPAQQPKLITGGIMKGYQLEGLYWLVSLYENGLNGILADEMGLGKTLQTISFLAFLKERQVNGPFLIAAPVSTLANWVDEIERFAPDMPVVMYHGHPDHREELRRTVMNPKNLGPNFPIVCTSYEIIMKDRKHLQRFAWKYIIIDEGHRIKNLNCKLIKELKTYTSANRLLLTGTPLQNNLSELWSLLNFLLPEVFDDLAFFQEYFDFSGIQGKDAKGREEFIKEEREANLVGSLHALLKPFLLRRVKTDVLTEMPPKREYVLYAPLTKTQKELYGRLLNHDARDWLLEKIMAAASVSSGNSNGTRSNGINGVSKLKRKLLELEDPAREPSSKRSRSTTPITGSGASTPKSSTTRTSVRRDGIKNKKQRSYRELSDDEWFDAIEAGDFDSRSASEPEDDYQRTLRAALKQVNNKKLQNLLIQLRQACNSPHLFYWPFPEDPGSESESESDTSMKPNTKKKSKAPKPKKPVIDYTPLVTESGKLLLLSRLLPALFARNHKVLIFSQFATMLDIIETWATHVQSWRCCRIDGSVPQVERREQIKEFNTNPDVQLFLLSTRAGGLGINLTAADTVVLFDSDWNPQADLQAQDRAHRIGQTKPVVVYRLATANTVEQTLLEKAEAKRRLEKLVIQKGKFRDLKATSGKTGADGVEEELSNILKEDFEKVNVVEEGGVVLSDAELERLLDRSEKAFENKDGVKGEDGMTGVRVV